jgi:hypothetical protein
MIVIIARPASPRAPHPAAGRLFFDFLFSRPAQLKLGARPNSDAQRVDADRRLNKGFKKVVQDLENENMRSRSNCSAGIRIAPE